MQEYLQLSPYPDVSEALRALQGRTLAILSNGSPAMLHAVVEHAGLAPLLHHVLSVDELRIYKPHPSVYRLAVEKLGTAKEQIAFVSSNFWDVSGATAFGFRTYWINRTGTAADELGLQPAGALSRLDELVDILN
jgi:2-haloacid dehalogenase